MNNYETETERLRGLVESSLSELITFPARYPNGPPKILMDAMGYTLFLPGKRIRPLLLLLACKAAGGDENDALPYACAIEFIHNYSLIHDDLPAMDDDDLRRGKPSNHKVFGEAMAILAGDGLLSRAFEVMYEDSVRFLNDAEALRRRILAGRHIAIGCGCMGMVAGQAADIEAEGKEASAKLLEYIHRNKTAALIRAAVEAGASLGGADANLKWHLSMYGINLGLAFQIADDILDFEGDTEVTGKTSGKDVKAGKAAYPAVHGIEASRKKLAEITDNTIMSTEAAKAEGADPYYTDIMKELAGRLAQRVR